MRLSSGHSLGHQEWSDHMQVASGDAGFQDGVIVTSHIAYVWECVCAYLYICTLLNTCFKVVMTINL